MKGKLFTIFFCILLPAISASAQTSWLDRPLTNWNSTVRTVPTAPRATGDAPTVSRCGEGIRTPESLADRALTRAGWTLFGASQTYGPVTLINGMASVDGMCRPMQYNTFVFVSNSFAGTLSPTVMDSRTDGALNDASLDSSAKISAKFIRYTSNDALCCPSQISTVSYTIAGARVTANDANTQAYCQKEDSGSTTENAVAGKINYTGRFGRQRNAVITVRLVDVSRANAPSTVVEQKIDVTGNQQFPVSYELKYEPNRIDQRNRYAVQAEMAVFNRTIARTETDSPVLTRGNPKNVDLTLVSAFGNQQNTDILSGTISYREKILLRKDASITVKLIDTAAAETAAPVAETTFSSNDSQVPIPFELDYQRNQIDLNRRYALRAEISIEGKPAWKTETDYAVLTQGNPTDNVQLMLVAVNQGPAVITGQTFNLSKFGTGTLQIEGRNATFLVRGSVSVKSDGSAEVSVSGLTGGAAFAGKLTYSDQNTLRITVENSGDADASGEIEIRYNGRRLNSITSNNLVLDGQNATLKF